MENLAKFSHTMPVNPPTNQPTLFQLISRIIIFPKTPSALSSDVFLQSAMKLINYKTVCYTVCFYSSAAAVAAGAASAAGTTSTVTTLAAQFRFIFVNPFSFYTYDNNNGIHRERKEKKNAATSHSISTNTTLLG